MLYILWGEDQFSLEEKLQEIKSSLGDLSLLSTNTSVLDGKKMTVSELQAVGEAMPFLAEKRLVVVRGLLERFEPKDKSSRPKKTGKSSAKKDDSQLIADCIKSLPESTILVLADIIEIKKNTLANNPLYNSICAKAEIKSFPQLKGVRLTQWIESRVTRQGGSISRQAANILMEAVGGDLHTMANEINKLTAYTGGRRIEENDVRMVVSASQEADIFAMIEAVMDDRAGTAEQILQKLLQNGVAPQQILVLIARQMQMLVQVKDLKAQKKTAPEIQSRLGIFNPYVWERISRRAEKYTLERLKQIYAIILDADLAIKTGKFDGDLALNLLVAELCTK